MSASLLNTLLSSLPPLLPLPTTKQPLPPPPPTFLPWRTPLKIREDGHLLPMTVAKSGHYNVQVVVGENEPEEVLLRRFKREVMKAGIIQECRRRMSFENAQDKKKRKARDAARRNRRRPFRPRPSTPKKQEESKTKKEEDEEDNWELPEGELPY